MTACDLFCIFPVGLVRESTVFYICSDSCPPVKSQWFDSWPIEAQTLDVHRFDCDFGGRSWGSRYLPRWRCVRRTIGGRPTPGGPYASPARRDRPDAHAPPPSAAFLERHGHWIVAAASRSACAAFNRPLEATRYSLPVSISTPLNVTSAPLAKRRPLILSWRLKRGGSTRTRSV